MYCITGERVRLTRNSKVQGSKNLFNRKYVEFIASQFSKLQTLTTNYKAHRSSFKYEIPSKYIDEIP